MEVAGNHKNLVTKISVLSQLILQGDTLKAMELFYADHVIMQENEDEPRKGKEICLEHERKNLKRVKSLESKLLRQAIDTENQNVFTEWHYIVTTNGNKQLKLTEVSIQQWENEMIVHEKFYYKEFKPI